MTGTFTFFFFSLFFYAEYHTDSWDVHDKHLSNVRWELCDRGRLRLTSSALNAALCTRVHSLEKKTKPTKTPRLSAQKTKKKLLGNTDCVARRLVEARRQKERRKERTEGWCQMLLFVWFFIYIFVWLTGRLNATFDSRGPREKRREELESWRVEYGSERVQRVPLRRDKTQTSSYNGRHLRAWLHSVYRLRTTPQRSCRHGNNSIELHMVARLADGRERLVRRFQKQPLRWRCSLK